MHTTFIDETLRIGVRKDNGDAIEEHEALSFANAFLKRECERRGINVDRELRRWEFSHVECVGYDTATVVYVAPGVSLL